MTLSGDFGKPRPALIIQANQFANTDTVTVLLISRTLVDAPLIRIDVDPRLENGLRKPSQIMIDKTMTLKRERVGQVLGQLDDGAMLSVSRAFAVFVGLA